MEHPPIEVPPQSFTVTAAPFQPPPETVPGVDLAHAIYENHPLTKAIIDLVGDGGFRMAAVSDAPDNAFFRIDAATGKIWFTPLELDSDRQHDPGDYYLLDFETPRDAGGNNIYDLQIIRTAPDGTQETIDLALTVQDLAIERTWATRDANLGIRYSA